MPDDFDDVREGEEVVDNNEAGEVDEEAIGEEPTAEDTYQVLVGNKTVSASLDDLKSTYAKNEKLKRDLESFEQDRNTFDQVSNRISSEYSEFLNKHEALEKLYKMAADGTLQPVKPKLSDFWNDDDPLEGIIAYSRARDAWDDQTEKRQQLAEHQYHQNMAAARQRREQEMAALKAAIPGFADPEKAPALQKEIADTISYYGLPESEFESLSDNRLVRLLYDAAQYRKMVSGVDGAMHKVKSKQVKSSISGKRLSKKDALWKKYRETKDENIALQILQLANGEK